jgi:hypothetical protein
MFKRVLAFLAALASVTTLGLVAAPAASADNIGITTWLLCKNSNGATVGSVRYTTATNSNGARKIAGVEWKWFSVPVTYIHVNTGPPPGEAYFFNSSDGGHVAGTRNTSSALPYLQQPRVVNAFFDVGSSGPCQVAMRDY